MFVFLTDSSRLLDFNTLQVTDLKHATLATVSRCGMVWFSEDVLSTVKWWISRVYHHRDDWICSSCDDVISQT
jgi:hypothetical protein